MAKKKTKKIPEIDMSALEGLGAQISGLASNLEEQLKPLMQMGDLQSHIEKLKKTTEEAAKQSKSNSNSSSSDDAIVQENEGDTCMHGNSWHSECVECNDLMLIDNIFDAVTTTPNDQELGGIIRVMCGKFKKESPHKTKLSGDKTAAETNDSVLGDDMNYHIKDEENNNSSDDSATKDRKRWAG
jgi:hypothetical protein